MGLRVRSGSGSKRVTPKHDDDDDMMMVMMIIWWWRWWWYDDEDDDDDGDDDNMASNQSGWWPPRTRGARHGLMLPGTKPHRGIQKYRHSEIQKYRHWEIQKYRNMETQKDRNTEILYGQMHLTTRIAAILSSWYTTKPLNKREIQKWKEYEKFLSFLVVGRWASLW